MFYICYYNCPKCKNPDCGESPMELANELVDADSKSEARQIFNQGKPCRHMKLVSIEATELCT